MTKAPGFSGTVDASHIEMDEVSMAKLAKALAKTHAVNRVVLQYCHLTAETVRILLDAIRDSPFIRTLDLSHNHLSTTAVRYLCEFLGRRGCSLTTLILNVAQLGPDEVAEIARGLEMNSSLRSLSLAGNDLRGGGVSVLCDGLMLNRTLVELDLSRNRLRDSGCQVIVELLQRAAHLKTLYLRANEIGSLGCTLLSHALEENRTLEVIDLGYNKIELDGVNELAVMLTVNTTLRTLVLSHNALGEYGAAVLARALGQNMSLRVLNLCGVRAGCHLGKTASGFGGQAANPWTVGRV